MLNNINKKNKCADIEFNDEYGNLLNCITNPYCYNFGKVEKSHNNNFMKLKNKINTDLFQKKKS